MNPEIIFMGRIKRESKFEPNKSISSHIIPIKRAKRKSKPELNTQSEINNLKIYRRWGLNSTLDQIVEVTIPWSLQKVKGCFLDQALRDRTLMAGHLWMILFGPLQQHVDSNQASRHDLIVQATRNVNWILHGKPCLPHRKKCQLIA